MAYHRSPALLQMIPRRINYRSFHHYWKLIRYHRGAMVCTVRAKNRKRLSHRRPKITWTRIAAIAAAVVTEMSRNWLPNCLDFIYPLS